MLNFLQNALNGVAFAVHVGGKQELIVDGLAGVHGMYTVDGHGAASFSWSWRGS